MASPPQYDLDAAPFEQFICRDDQVPDMMRLRNRKPPTCIATRGCLHVCCTGCGEHHCLTRAFGEYIKVLMKGAGMHGDGTFDRSKMPDGPARPAGRYEKEGVEIVDIVVPLVLCSPEQGPGSELVDSGDGTKGMLVRLVKPLALLGKENTPVVVYLHGGGFVIGDARSETVAKSVVRLATELGAYVVVPHYRRAPENRFPVPVLDSYDALRWLASDAADAELPGLDRSRLGISGDSAGANLTLVMATLLRDGLQGDLTPAPAEMQRLRAVFLAPLFPPLFLNRLTPSANQFHNAPLLPGFASDWFGRAYLRESLEESDRLLEDRRVCPLQAERGLEGLPPTTIISGGRDPLRDDSRILELALAKHGVDVRHWCYQKGSHVFHLLPWEPSKRAYDFVSEGWRLALEAAASQPVKDPTAAGADEPFEAPAR